jgi:hypothetical protein
LRGKESRAGDAQHESARYIKVAPDCRVCLGHAKSRSWVSQVKSCIASVWVLHAAL